MHFYDQIQTIVKSFSALQKSFSSEKWPPQSMFQPAVLSIRHLHLYKKWSGRVYVSRSCLFYGEWYHQSLPDPHLTLISLEWTKYTQICHSHTSPTPLHTRALFNFNENIISFGFGIKNWKTETWYFWKKTICSSKLKANQIVSCCSRSSFCKMSP